MTGPLFPDRVLADAVERLEAWITHGDYQSPTPLADALNALYMLDEHFKAQKSGSWAAAQAGTPGGRVASGLTLVRGRMVHSGGQDVAYIAGSRPFTMGRSTLRGGDTLRGPGVTVVWPELVALPRTPLADKVETPDRRQHYTDHVAGNDVLDTFDTATRFFAALR